MYGTAADRGVPVPNVLAVDLPCTLLLLDVFLMEEVCGVALAELWRFPDEAPLAVARPPLAQAGAWAARLHAWYLDGSGTCDDDHVRATGAGYGQDPSWRTALLGDAQRDRTGLAGAGGPEAEVAATVREVMDAVGATLECFDDACLLHGALQVSHVFVDRAALTVRALIAFGEAGVGDPVWDLDRFSAAEDETRWRSRMGGNAWRTCTRRITRSGRGRRCGSA
ncbi:MAG: aminoglycoside phosphotransferase family protein [Actinomycetota bacterium]|nr:aminoglycoside phosphotransferase family protein [Actinomycetota bacterium]